MSVDPTVGSSTVPSVQPLDSILMNHDDSANYSEPEHTTPNVQQPVVVVQRVLSGSVVAQSSGGGSCYRTEVNVDKPQDSNDADAASDFEDLEASETNGSSSLFPMNSKEGAATDSEFTTPNVAAQNAHVGFKPVAELKNIQEQQSVGSSSCDDDDNEIQIEVQRSVSSVARSPPKPISMPDISISAVGGGCLTHGANNSQSATPTMGGDLQPNVPQGARLASPHPTTSQPTNNFSSCALNRFKLPPAGTSMSTCHLRRGQSRRVGENSNKIASNNNNNNSSVPAGGSVRARLDEDLHQAFVRKTVRKLNATSHLDKSMRSVRVIQSIFVIVSIVFATLTLEIKQADYWCDAFTGGILTYASLGTMMCTHLRFRLQIKQHIIMDPLYGESPHVRDSPYYNRFLVESFACVIHCPPLLTSQLNHSYRMLNLFVLFRVVLLFPLLKDWSPINNFLGRVLARLSNISFDMVFILRTQLHDRPIPLVFGALLSSLLLLSVGVAVAEDLTYGDAVWSMLATATTVGYGDIVPGSALGRLLAAFMSICGLVCISLMIAVVNRKLDLSEREKRVLLTLEYHKSLQRVQRCAARVIAIAWQRKCALLKIKNNTNNNKKTTLLSPAVATKNRALGLADDAQFHATHLRLLQCTRMLRRARDDLLEVSEVTREGSSSLEVYRMFGQDPPTFGGDVGLQALARTVMQNHASILKRIDGLIEKEEVNSRKPGTLNERM
eukprot:PhM_4_TR15923/c0_g1_i2/m.11366